MSAPIPAHERRFCPLDEALFAAYHEAGHAVAALLVDPPRPLVWVRIEVDEHGGSGQTRYEGTGGPLPYGRDEDVNADRRRAETDAVVSIAGPLCAMWYSTGRYGCDVLAPEALESLHFCLLKRKDWKRVRVIALLLHGFNSKRKRSWRDAMLERALELMVRSDFRDSVAAVASALVRKGRLERAEVEVLVRKAKDLE